MLDALVFWLLVEAIGLIGLPFAAGLFSRLPGGGWAFARPLGLLLVAYPLWLLVALNAIRTRGLALPSTTRGRRSRVCSGSRPVHASAGSANRAGPWLWLVGELLFATGFGFWALIRSFAPEIVQTEKPMDMAIVNSINAGESFPPHDPWFAGDPPQLLLLRPLHRRPANPHPGHRTCGRLQPGARDVPRTDGDRGLRGRLCSLPRASRLGLGAGPSSCTRRPGRRRPGDGGQSRRRREVPGSSGTAQPVQLVRTLAGDPPHRERVLRSSASCSATCTRT